MPHWSHLMSIIPPELNVCPTNITGGIVLVNPNQPKSAAIFAISHNAGTSVLVCRI